MADAAETSGTPIIPENNPTNAPREQKTTPTKKKNSPTMKKGAGLNKIKTDELLKWTVFVQAETKTAVGKASTKAGITVTDWIDSRLREAATAELTNKPQPPAKMEDVTDLIKNMAEQLKTAQEATTKAQSDLIEQQGKQIAALTDAIQSQPRGLKELLFGKSKPIQGQ